MDTRKALAKAVLESVDEFLELMVGERLGVTLFIYDLGDEGTLQFVSNTEEDDATTMLLEFLARTDPAMYQQALERVEAQRIHGAGSEVEN